MLRADLQMSDDRPTRAISREVAMMLTRWAVDIVKRGDAGDDRRRDSMTTAADQTPEQSLPEVRPKP